MFMQMESRFFLVSLLLTSGLICAADRPQSSAPAPGKATDGEWPVYGHDPGGQRHSPLKQIDKSNVSQLKVAWTFHTGDIYQPKHSKAASFEATPLYVDGTLYLSTPLGRVMALDPLSGKQRWSFDPKIEKDAGYGDYANRGLSAWKSPAGKLHVFVATIDARLIVLDASTGERIASFGDEGEIDLRQGLRLGPRDFSDYEETSPPAIIGNLVVLGSAVADNQAVTEASGEVRAYDAGTGRLRWSWDPIPQEKSDPAASTWKKSSARRTGAANAWSIFAVDPAHDLVYVPTGSPSPDYYGGERLGDNRYANSITALNASTGKVVWSFQTVHHDLWDYDVASPPLLFDVHRGGRIIPALAVGSKTAHLFILNRLTGQPIFSVEEKPAPKSTVPGEEASATQPVPVLPKPLSRQAMTADEAWGLDDGDRNWCKSEISKLRNEGVFTPPSLEGTLAIPGNIGGMNWSGAAFDPDQDLLVLPSSNLVAEVRLIPRESFETERGKNRDLQGNFEFAPQRGTPYGMARKFLVGPHYHLPCVPPPWGLLTAIKASTGEIAWQIPLGQMAGTEVLPQAKGWGSPSLGGPITTASGITFIAGTIEAAIHAFDTATGKELWKGHLPTSARATPMTFLGPDGKQYLVICAGGHEGAPGGLPLGDEVVAFALP
jgi:quinoprotein glucose dehydrogenase